MKTAAIASAARDRADRIRAGLDVLAPDIIAAWQARDWETLGYDSWQAYVVGEFGGQLRLGRDDRRQAVTAMRAEGMTLRAIGSAVGVVPGTVINDLMFKNEHEQEEQPIERDWIVWGQLSDLMQVIEPWTKRDAHLIADSVPHRRRAATAKRLRKLGLGLGRIAQNLERMEEQSDDTESD